MFVVTGKNTLLICPADEPIEPKPGQTVIAFVDAGDNLANPEQVA
jgi:hypothetical protein